MYFALGLASGLVGGVIITVMATVGLFLDRTDTVHTYPEPRTSSYAAAVKRVHSPMAYDQYEIWFGPFDKGGVPRGHVVAIPLGWSTEPNIDWYQDTVAVHFDPGGEIRVPMAMITDTR